MDISPAQVNELIRKRRSIFPKTYNSLPIERSVVEQILENANWAPTHKLTQPWRFRVIIGAGLERLATFMAKWYRENTPEEQFSEAKFMKLKTKPLKASCIIAICMKRDPKEQVPEWEELASVACAVQNMWLTCTAHDIGCYWSSPAAALHADEFLQLGEGERCLGLFYMGRHEMPEIPGKRTPIADKTVWISE